MRTNAKLSVRRRFDAQQLEPRLPLAGLVTAAISEGGDLVIEGDEQDNQLVIALEGNQIVVAGLDPETQVNERDAVRFERASLTGGLRVHLLGGNDVLRLGGEAHEPHIAEVTAEDDDHDHGDSRLSIPGDVFIKTGAGSDSVRVSFVDIQGDLSIHTSSDEVSDDDADTVNLGRGPSFEDDDHHDDHMASDQATVVDEPTVHDDSDCGDEGPPPDVKVGGETRVLTGEGADSVRMAFASFEGNVQIRTGAGEDLVITGRGPIRGKHGGGGCGSHRTSAVPAEHNGRPVDVRVRQDAAFDFGPDDDFGMLRNMQVQGSLVVRSGKGDDAIGSQNLRLVDDARIQTGPGHDTVGLMQSRFASSLKIDTGPGNDVVTLDRVRVAEDLDLAMLASDDTLVIVDSLFSAAANLDGGAGHDHLAIRDSDFSDPAEKKSWELYDLGIIDEVLQSTSDLFGPFLQGH